MQPVSSAQARCYLINSNGEPVEKPGAQPLPGWKFKNKHIGSEKELALQIAPTGKVYRLVGRFWNETNSNRIPIEEDGRFGYVDLKGKLVIPAIYEEVKNFSGGVTLVKAPGDLTYSLINESGKVLDHLPANLTLKKPPSTAYPDAWYRVFGNGLVKVFKSDRHDVKYGMSFAIYNLKRKRFVQLPEFDYLEEFVGGMAKITVSEKSADSALFLKSRKIGFIDQDGELAIPCIYDQAAKFSEGLCPVKYENRWFYIDKTGQEVITLPRNCVIAQSFNEGRAAIGLSKYIPASSTSSVSERWVYHPSCVVEKYSWAVIDSSGKTIIPGKYASSYQYSPRFSDGLCPARLGSSHSGPVGFIDRDGKWAIAPQFDSASSFGHGIAEVWIPDKAFSQENWNKKIGRWAEFEQFLSQNQLIGMARTSLINQLGEPDSAGAEKDKITYNFWSTETRSLGVDITVGAADKVVSYKYVHLGEVGRTITENDGNFEWQ